MAQNIFSHRVLRRKSMSIEKSAAPQLQHQLQIINNIPTVTAKKQADINQKPSIKLRESQITGILDENRKLKTTSNDQGQQSMFEEIGILSKYIREIKQNKQSQDVQITYRKQLSQSVKLSEEKEKNTFPFENPRSKTIQTIEESKKNLKVRFSTVTEENDELNNSNFSHKITIFQKCNSKIILNTKNKKPKSCFHKKLTFRIIVLFVKAAMRLSKKYRYLKSLFRMIHQKQLLEYTKLAHLREPHRLQIEKFQYEYLKRQHKKYVEMISKKMLFYLEEPPYIRECQLIWQKQGKLEYDLKKTRFCVLSKMFMQNLEFLTRGDNLPHLIQHQLNACLFKSKEKLQSQFVSKRGQLFSKQLTQMSQENKILIAAEFFLFQIISPNILELFNELQTSEANHKNQTLYYCVLIINLLSTLFVAYFSKMTILEKSNISPIQRKFIHQTNKVTGQMDLNIEIISKLDEDEQKIVSGYFLKSPIQGILMEREKWAEKMQVLFSQIISNLVNHITI